MLSLPPRGIHRGCSRRPVIHRRWSRGSKSLLAALRVCGRGRDCQGLNCFRAPCLVLQDHTTRRASRQMHPRTQIIRTSTSNHQTNKPTNKCVHVCGNIYVCTGMRVRFNRVHSSIDRHGHACMCALLLCMGMSVGDWASCCAVLCEQL